MTKPLDRDTITITLDHVTRGPHGSSASHGAGGTASITGGKTYGTYVFRILEEAGPTRMKRRVSYEVGLWLDGRKVRDNALLELRGMIVAQFKIEMAKMVVQAERAWQAQAAAIAVGEDEHVRQPSRGALSTSSDQVRIAALGLHVTHYATVNGQFQPMDALASDGSRLIVYREADRSYGFAGWCPWAAKPFGSHGGRYQTFAGALAWLEAREA